MRIVSAKFKINKLVFSIHHNATYDKDLFIEISQGLVWPVHDSFHATDSFYLMR